MIGDLVAVNLHELGKPLHILNHLNPILLERSHGRDKAVPEALHNHIIFFRIFRFGLFNDLDHPSLDKQRTTGLIAQPDGSHHARSHQHRNMPFLERHNRASQLGQATFGVE